MTIKEAKKQKVKLLGVTHYSKNKYYIETTYRGNDYTHYLNTDGILRKYTSKDSRIFFNSEKGALKAIKDYETPTVSLYSIYSLKSPKDG